MIDTVLLSESRNEFQNFYLEVILDEIFKDNSVESLCVLSIQTIFIHVDLL